MGVAMVNEEWKIVQLCLTYSCQCNCLHCGVRDINTQLKEELTLAQIERIFDDLKALHCQAIDLSGGEPTMRKDLFDIIRLGKQRQFLMTIETNGLNLTPLVLAKLKQSKIDKVFFGKGLLEVQGRGKDNVTLDANNTRSKLILKLSVSDTLGCARHLSQQLFQSSERANERSLKHVCHLADLRETSTLRTKRDNISI